MCSRKCARPGIFGGSERCPTWAERVAELLSVVGSEMSRTGRWLDERVTWRYFLVSLGEVSRTTRSCELPFSGGVDGKDDIFVLILR